MACLERSEIDGIGVIVPLDEPDYALEFLTATVASFVCYLVTKF
jgi:hypothetical protein